MPEHDIVRGAKLKSPWQRTKKSTMLVNLPFKQWLPTIIPVILADDSSFHFLFLVILITFSLFFKLSSALKCICFFRFRFYSFYGSSVATVTWLFLFFFFPFFVISLPYFVHIFCIYFWTRKIVRHLRLLSPFSFS